MTIVGSDLRGGGSSQGHNERGKATGWNLSPNSWVVAQRSNCQLGRTASLDRSANVMRVGRCILRNGNLAHSKKAAPDREFADWESGAGGKESRLLNYEDASW